MVSELALVLGLLVSSSCEVRGRDPDVEDNAQKDGPIVRGPLQGATAAALPAARENFRSRNAVSHCPLYKQQQLILLWCCCSGNRGEHDGTADAGSGLVLDWPLAGASHSPGRPISVGTGGFEPGAHPLADPSREQNDQHRGRAPSSLRAGALRAFEPNSAQDSYKSSARPGAAPFSGPPEEPRATPGPHPRGPLQRYDSFLAPLPVPHMMALLMSQLQPVIDSFNASLQQLSQQVGVLAHEVARLKRPGGWEGREEPAARAPDPAGESERRGAPTEENRKLGEAGLQTELRLQTQHALLLGNLSRFQREMDQRLQRLQRLQQRRQDDATPAPVQTGSAHGQLQAEVRALARRLDSVDGRCQQLRRDAAALNERINQTARTGQVQFMETGLEVEAAREAVLRRVTELAGNLSGQDRRLQEAETDLDYLFTTVSRLEMGWANLTEQVGENRLALEEERDSPARPGDRTHSWEPAVEALQRGLQQVRTSAVSEQARTRAAELGLTRLGDSLAQLRTDVRDQEEERREQAEALARLSGSFKSLLQDGIRHNDVLELLLGEEVLEFLEWPVLDQEAHSIPALKDQLHLLQEQLATRSQRTDAGSSMENASDEPRSSGPPREQRRSIKPRAPAAAPPGPGRDGGDLWRLEQQVAVLGQQLRLHEAQLPRLKTELQDHLRVFQKIFRNADRLADSDTPVDLLKIWRLAGGPEAEETSAGFGSHDTHETRPAREIQVT